MSVSVGDSSLSFFEHSFRIELIKLPLFNYVDY